MTARLTTAPRSAVNTRRSTAACAITGRKTPGRLQHGTTGCSLPPGGISLSSTATTGCSPPPLPTPFRGSRAAGQIYGSRTSIASRTTAQCSIGCTRSKRAPSRCPGAIRRSFSLHRTAYGTCGAASSGENTLTQHRCASLRGTAAARILSSSCARSWALRTSRFSMSRITAIA